MNCKKVILLRSNPVNPDPPVEKMAERYWNRAIV